MISPLQSAILHHPSQLAFDDGDTQLHFAELEHELASSPVMTSSSLQPGDHVAWCPQGNDLDAFVTNDFGPNRVWLNDEDGGGEPGNGPGVNIHDFTADGQYLFLNGGRDVMRYRVTVPDRVHDPRQLLLQAEQAAGVKLEGLQLVLPKP